MNRILILVFVVICLGSCNTYTKQAMKFEINPALLGSTKKDTLLKISYATPSTFIRSTNESQIKEQAGMQKEGVSIQTVYQDDRTQAFMIVSSLSKSTWKNLKNQFQEDKEENETQVWNTMQATSYEYNSFNVQQWLLQNQSWVNFKLVYESRNQHYFQVDYLVPVAFYDEIFAKAIESSIGSFKSL